MAQQITEQYKHYDYPLKARVITSGVKDELDKDSKYGKMAITRDTSSVQYLVYITSINTYSYCLCLAECSPSNDEIVCVLFEGGDVRYPIIIGRLSESDSTTTTETMEEG